MKLIATLIASAFAVTAFAAEPAKKEEVKPAVVAAPAKSEVKPAVIGGDKGKAPVKSTPAKDEKAAVPATKPASK